MDDSTAYADCWFIAQTSEYMLIDSAVRSSGGQRKIAEEANETDYVPDVVNNGFYTI